MNNILKTATKVTKVLKGRVNFVNVEKYANELGYKIIFFNTSEGDAELIRFNKTETAQRNKAFTYCGSANIIFINNNASAEDKLIFLLHEIGHILLKHIGDNKLHTRNKFLIDVEADVFTYAILNPQKPSKLKTLFVLMAMITCFICGCCVPNPLPSEKNHSASEAVSVTAPTEEKQTENIAETNIETTVYITRTGKKFHRLNCRYVKYKTDTTPLERAEAEKSYTSCDVCNP